MATPNRNTDQHFKKTEQVIGRPQTTSHNIAEDYMRDPPHVRFPCL